MQQELEIVSGQNAKKKKERKKERKTWTDWADANYIFKQGLKASRKQKLNDKEINVFETIMCIK